MSSDYLCDLQFTGLWSGLNRYHKSDIACNYLGQHFISLKNNNQNNALTMQNFWHSIPTVSRDTSNNSNDNNNTNNNNNSNHHTVPSYSHLMRNAIDNATEIPLFGAMIQFGDLQQHLNAARFFVQAVDAFSNFSPDFIPDFPSSNSNWNFAEKKEKPADPKHVSQLVRRTVTRPEELKEYTCSICLDNCNDNESTQGNNKKKCQLIQLPCLHEFHETCLLTHFKTNHICPLCRYPLRTLNEKYNRDFVAPAVEKYEQVKREQLQRQRNEQQTQQRFQQCAMQVRNNIDQCVLLHPYLNSGQKITLSNCRHVLHKECLISNSLIAKGPKLNPTLVNQQQPVNCPFCGQFNYIIL